MLETQFRPVASLAVAGCISAAIGSMSFHFQPFVAFSVAGCVLGCTARRSIQRYQLSGRSLAFLAIVVSAISMLFSPLWHDYRYRSETLPNHSRIAFEIGDDGKLLDAYDRKRVCIKGYCLYDTSDELHNDFALSPDGNVRKPESAIRVIAPSGWHCSMCPIAVSGILSVDHSATDHASRYTLTATKICEANTPYRLGSPFPGGC